MCLGIRSGVMTEEGMGTLFFWHIKSYFYLLKERPKR